MRKRTLKIGGSLLALPRTAKRIVALSADFCFCVFSVWFAYYLRLGEFLVLSDDALPAVVASIALALPIFIVFGLYRAIFRYSGWPALLAVVRAISLYGLVYASFFTAIGFPGVPRTIGIIQPILLLLLVGASRALASLWLGDQYRSILKRVSRRKTLIYGAGRTGRQLADALANSHEMQVLGFLDDDENLQGQLLNGLPVYNPVDLKDLVSVLDISDVLLAMPGINRRYRNEILNNVAAAQVAVRTVPSVTDLAQGKVSVSDLRQPDIDDLLGREPVAPNPTLLAKNVAGKVVLVTGAGGSIGSELCRQILLAGPAKLILVEQSEFALYTILQELEDKPIANKATLVPLIASVQDDHRIREIMSLWQPDTVYHAAAYKHVPLVESNPEEGIKNNVFGTLRTAKAAADFGVADFVVISTDKAVRPTNMMGATKRLAEMVLQAMADVNPGTNFTIVRFGNVLDSSGSVVPRFRDQIRNGGPITVTHPDIIRYFMTIPEAAQLVIQAGAMAARCNVFVLDMGQPVKIMDLARRMAALSGLTVCDKGNPEGDIEIEVTGLRPGEKLYEELLIGGNPEPTIHPKILRAREDFIPWSDLHVKLDELSAALSMNNVEVVRKAMSQLVPEYKFRLGNDGNDEWMSKELVNIFELQH